MIPYRNAWMHLHTCGLHLWRIFLEEALYKLLITITITWSDLDWHDLMLSLTRFWPRRTGTRCCTLEWPRRLRGPLSTSSSLWRSETTFSSTSSSPFSLRDLLPRSVSSSDVARHKFNVTITMSPVLSIYIFSDKIFFFLYSTRHVFLYFAIYLALFHMFFGVIQIRTDYSSV